MSSEGQSYSLPATKLIPNSPYPLLHYSGHFPLAEDKADAASVNDVFSSNGVSDPENISATNVLLSVFSFAVSMVATLYKSH